MSELPCVFETTIQLFPSALDCFKALAAGLLCELRYLEGQCDV